VRLRNQTMRPPKKGGHLFQDFTDSPSVLSCPKKIILQLLIRSSGVSELARNSAKASSRRTRTRRHYSPLDAEMKRAAPLRRPRNLIVRLTCSGGRLLRVPSLPPPCCETTEGERETGKTSANDRAWNGGG
jgi:hypothetical protein